MNRGGVGQALDRHMSSDRQESTVRESGLYHLWEVPGAMPWPVLYSRELVQTEDRPGNCLTVFTDLDKLAEHLMALVPEDGRAFDPKATFPLLSRKPVQTLACHNQSLGL